MRFLASVVAITVLTPGLAGAQAGTSDGIQALIRGDYASAVRILRPLAEETPTPDPVAQFFMATLYQHGLGVRRSSVHACALFTAAATAPTILRRRSHELATSLHHDVPQLVEECQTIPSGEWRTPAAAAFVLGPEHSVTFNDTLLTVSYNGEQLAALRIEWGPGLRFLPIRHTALDVSTPAGTRRDFIEFFVWTPVKNPAAHAWTLMWSVYEIAGLRVVPVPGHRPLTTFAGAVPPTSSDDRALARIQTTADGEVEQVVQGSDPSVRIIPYPEVGR